ncbi:MAG: hypothetical protein WAM97_18485 [Acidimicrobiales bacterium]
MPLRKEVLSANVNGNSVDEFSTLIGDRVGVISGAKYRFRDSDAISSDGTHVWVANYSGDSLTALNASTDDLIQVIDARSDRFDYPSGIPSDGRHVWVANIGSKSTGGNSVTQLSVSTGDLVKVRTGSTYEFHGPPRHLVGRHRCLGDEPEPRHPHLVPGVIPVTQGATASNGAGGAIGEDVLPRSTASSIQDFLPAGVELSPGSWSIIPLVSSALRALSIDRRKSYTQSSCPLVQYAK